MKIETVGNTAPTDAMAKSDEATAASHEPVTRLPDPVQGMVLSDDAIAQIAGMLTLALREDRKSARKLAQSEGMIQARESAMRVSEMKKQAAEIRAAGVEKAITGCVQAALQLGAASTAVWGVSTKTPEGATASEKLQAQWRAQDAWSAGLNAGSTVTGAVATLSASEHEAAGKLHEAEAARHESAAAAAKRHEEQYLDEAGEAKRLLDKVAEFLKEVRSSQNASAQAALYRA